MSMQQGATQNLNPGGVTSVPPITAPVAPAAMSIPAPMTAQQLLTQKYQGSTQSVIGRLLEQGVVTQAQAQSIEQQSMSTGKSIEEVVLSGLFVDPQNLIRAKSIVYKIPFVNLKEVPIPVALIQKLRSDVAQKYSAIIFDEKPDHFKVAMIDPLDIQATSFIGAILGKRVDTYFAEPGELNHILETKYGTQVGSDVSKALQDVNKDILDITGNIDIAASLQGDISSAPVARIVNVVLEYAVRMKASDIHIECRENKVVVRDRIHGVLSEKLVLPSKLAPALVSRIKILSNLKIDEHRVPQDGRFQIKVDQDFIDLRVSIIPTAYGENVVMRILEKGGGAISLDKTGLRGRNLEVFMQQIKKTMGIILVTGPTGSGKTVTLASCLKLLNTEGVNIMTLEDPVEIRIDGVNQVQINTEVGLTFAKGLRSFLRQDPNVIMIGEIRDSETAELAVQAALTGHLVLATLHTNSAATAIPRLIDMGVEPFLLASTINIAAAQRLIRRNCDECKEKYIASPEEISKIREVLSSVRGFNFDNLISKYNGQYPLFRGKGCDACANTGYKGRIGIYEVMEITEKIRSMIISHEAAQTIEKVAINENYMSTMLQDGLFKVLEGMTTLEEIYRVIS